MSEKKPVIVWSIAVGALFLALGGMCDAVTLSAARWSFTLEDFLILTFLSWPVIVLGLVLVLRGARGRSE